MPNLIITKADLDETGLYVGAAGNVECDGSIIIEAELGTVRFAASVNAKGHIEISAGSGISAGFSVTCSGVLEFGISLFAGVCTWRKTTEAERTITCKRLEPRDGAAVEYGIVKPAKK